MKILFNLLILLFIGVIVVNGQISEGGFPVSLQDPEIKINTIPSIKLNVPNLDILRIEDNVNDAIKGRLRIGTLINSNIQFGQEAEFVLLKDGRKLFRLAIHGESAQALNFYFKNFEIPIDDQLFIYNNETNQTLGAFTSRNNSQNKAFATGFVYGENVILEYIQSPTNVGIPDFVIEQVGYAYRNVYTNDLTEDFGGSESCEVNANCSEGDKWIDEKKSAIRILIKEGSSLFWCTGTTINNERKDCTPYLLTAEHCGQTASTSDINQWIFYFQYEAPNCSNPPSEGTLASRSLTGATLKAQSDDNGGDTGSDMMLLELKDDIPDAYTPYYAGWSKSEVGATSGVGIHHPRGDIKKISTFASTLTTTSFGTSNANAHWAVTWVETTNGHGITEQGSSGSGLFDQNGRLVGTLTGGEASCGNTEGKDEYGKFSYHWESNGNGQNRQLKSWLDPDDTGITELDGKASCSLIELKPELEPEVLIFPNPTDKFFVFESSNTTSTYANVRILNTLGQELGCWDRVANYETISLDHYISGIYLVELEFGEQIIIKKLIINK